MPGARVTPCLGFAPSNKVPGSCREFQNKVLVSVGHGKSCCSCLVQNLATVHFGLWILGTLYGPINRPKLG